MFIVSNVLLISSPPALTLAQVCVVFRTSMTYPIDTMTDTSGVGSQMTQAVSGDAFERLLSRTIFWSYYILTPITTIFYVVLGLWLTRL